MEQHQFGLREWADLCERKDATIAALQARLESANKLIYKKNCELGRAETINNDLQAELERVRKRVGPRGLEVVMIGEVGHYVSAAVKEELERVRGLIAANKEIKHDAI